MCSITKRNPESKKNYPLPSPVSCFSYSNVEPRTVSDKDAVRFAVSADNSKTAGGAKKVLLLVLLNLSPTPITIKIKHSLTYRITGVQRMR